MRLLLQVSSRWHFIGCVLAALTFAVPDLAKAVETPVRAALNEAIQAALPGASIVGRAEVDSKSCAPLPAEPTIVRADFNGDGHDDIAVIAKLNGSPDIIQWQGQTFRQARFALALVLGDGRGRYTVRIAKRFTSYLPLATYIDVISAGMVQDRETRKQIQLKHPGVALVFCEKSATGFYFIGNKIRQLSLVD